MLFKLKTGMGKHRIRRDGRMVVLKPGDNIDCKRDELGGAIDKFEQLEPDPPPPEPKLGLKLVARGGNWFDVVNETTGKAINDRPMRRQEAEKLAQKIPDELPPAISKFYLSAHGDGSYNVIDQDGKQINDKSLNKGEAVDLAAKMTNEAVNLNCDSRSKGKGEKSKEK